MGEIKSIENSRIGNQNQVILHIYDVPEANNYIKILAPGLGVFHTGVQVFGKEYSFGGHQKNFSGIFVTPPKDTRSLSVNETFKYKQSKLIGYTKLSDEEIQDIVKEMGTKQFRGIDYNLIRKNCNHFSDAFCKKLCGKSIPQWINQLVKIVAQYPWLEQRIPKEYITPKRLAEDVKNKSNKTK
ncbi:deubiquitinase DESI2-like [Oppia nitens]|uniref:deubiquitinase DESI2-like n=1 Tax=Oppia nitens TaxID=1686743 RepID=UPI0023DA189A|nr:deubiquitinase DESI2-like [Oppia nitens]